MQIEFNKSNVNQSLLDWQMKRPKGLSKRKKIEFFKELHMGLQAGLSLKKAVDLIYRTNGIGKRNNAVLSNLIAALNKGQSFSSAYAGQVSKTPLDQWSLSLAEQTGNLKEVLIFLGNYYQAQKELTSQIQKALIYPLFVLGLSFGILYFMITMVIPMFESTFTQAGVELPALTRFVLSLANHSGSIFLVFLLVIGGIILFVFGYRNYVKVRSMAQSMFQKLPGVRSFHLAAVRSKFCQLMTLMLQSRHPFEQALNKASSACDNVLLASEVQKIQGVLIRSDMPVSSLAEKVTYFSGKMLGLIEFGIETGQIKGAFEHLAKEQYTILENQTKVLSKLLEPIMILLVASMIGIILVAMYMPIFNLTTGIS